MQAKASQAKLPSSSEGKTETSATPGIPLKTQFEQLQSSEQGLTGEEAQKRLATLRQTVVEVYVRLARDIRWSVALQRPADDIEAGRGFCAYSFDGTHGS